MDLPEFETPATIGRDAPDVVAPTKPVLAPSTRLRDALNELRQVAENAVASAVESDLNTAIGQATKTLGNFDRARQSAESKPVRDPESCAVSAVADPGTKDLSRGFASAPKVLAPPPGKDNIFVRSLNFDSLSASPLRSGCSYFRRGIWPAAICACLLFFTSLFAILAVDRNPVRPDVNRPQSAIAAASYDADPRDVANGQVLTVMAGSQQTLRELSLLYVGRFDSGVFNEICALNPELKDPNHIEAGQLVRIRLPQGTLKKVTDTADISSASKAKNSAGFVARMVRWLGGA